MLARLQVREKLNLLVVIPLVMAAVLLVPWLATTVDAARTSGVTATTASLARTTSGAVQSLQQARLLAVAYLSAPGAEPNDFVVQLQQARAELTDLRAAAVEARRDPLASAADRLDDLSALGSAVVSRAVDAGTAVRRFDAIVDGLIDALGLGRDRSSDAAEALTLGGLDALLRSDESSSRSGALLLAAATAAQADRAALLADSDTAAVRAAVQGELFARDSDRAAGQLYEQVLQGPTAATIGSVRDVIARADARPTVTEAAQVLSSVRSLAALRQLVEARVSQDVATAAEARARSSRLAAYGLGLVAAIVLAGVVGLSVVVGRSVSRPLRRLTAAAGRVADLAQDELLRVADEDTGGLSDAVPRLAAIDVRTMDEIGDLADAFNRVQATAALLLERQVVGRHNVAAMFASVGRRTSNLVGRQLALIDALERAEEDPDRLSTLYRLDHLSTRLRRNASSLVVLSGTSESPSDGVPLPIADAVRGALGSVEEYQRVTLGDLPPVHLAPQAAADLVLLLAELVENAVLFSPPRTNVEVGATMLDDGSCRVTVVDHGMGMPADRLDVENARLRRRERLDLAPTNVLGLFVVGRIARRYGLDVRLEPTPEHGITAVVIVPRRLLVVDVPNVASFGRGRRAARPRTRDERAASGGQPPGWAPPEVLPEGLPNVATLSLPVVDVPEVPLAPTDPPAPAAAADRTGDAPGGLSRRVPGRAWAADPDGGAVQVAWAAPPDVPRRVPGRAWSTDAAFGPGAAVSRTVADPAQTRRELDALDVGLARARDGLPLQDAPEATVTGAPPAVVSAPEDGGGVPRRVPGAALQSLESDPGSAAPPMSRDTSAGPGRHAGERLDAQQVRSQLEELGEAVTSARQDVRARSEVPWYEIRRERTAAAPPPQPEPEPASGPERGSRSTGSPTPPRRVPGATLTALEAAAATVTPPPDPDTTFTPPDPHEALGLVHELEAATSEAALQASDPTGDKHE